MITEKVSVYALPGGGGAAELSLIIFYTDALTVISRIRYVVPNF